MVPVLEQLLGRWGTFGCLASAEEEEIADVIRPLGLSRIRSKQLKALGVALVAHGGVPDSLPALQSLPGVGPYTAGAVLSTAFHQRSPVTDGVSARVYRRLSGGLDPDATAAILTPTQDARWWNWAVLDLASSFCRPKRPLCPECPLRKRCSTALDPP